MKPTYDELFALVQHQSQVVFDQQQTIKRLEKRAAEFEALLRFNSKNNSKPSFSDQKTFRDTLKKGRAKPGHSRHVRTFFAQERIDH